MNIVVKTLLVAVCMLCFDLLIVCIAGGSGSISVPVAVIIITLTVALEVILLLKFLVLPIQKLYEAVVLIDFGNDIIDFTKVDSLKIEGLKEVRFLQNKFKYLIERLSDRIDRINNVTYESEHDKLTKCYNRERLEKYQSSYEEAKSCCIIFIDVNNLKRMNDQFGHNAGDSLLENAADKIRFWSTYGDVYRVGGDEFIVVIVNQTEGHIKRLFDTWYPTVGVLNRQSDGFKCVLSCGIAYASDRIDFEALRKIADDRMYEAKVAIKEKFGEPLR